MQRIAYNNSFNQPVDLLHGTQLLYGIGGAENLSQAYDAWPELDGQLTVAANDWNSKNHQPTLETLILKDQESGKTVFYEIESACGDDEEITTNSHAYGPLRITAAPVVSRVILSVEDCGISQQLFNYTEGWILVPFTLECTFEAVNRRHQREGVPFLLDPIHLKLISAVRKQSRLENDLESKTKKVFQRSSWINRFQFTYDYHQMMKILAVNVFDFRDARSFPYLFESEGGCGGLPPYGNIDTMISGMHAFHKGKAKRTILGLMKESVAIHTGELEPRSSFFIRSSHIAQLGDKAWEKYDHVYRTILEGTRGIDAANIVNILAGKDHLPNELLSKAAEIEPDNIIVGVAISHLRQDKFVMTELDVKLQLENLRKVKALAGDIPYRQILLDVEAEKDKIKSNSWTVLGKISEYLDASHGLSEVELVTIPDGPDQYFERRSIVQNYYTLRAERFADFSSFAYTDAIRVFKTSDVLDYVQKRGNLLREDISSQIHPQLATSISQDIVAERLRKESIFKWLNSADLNDLLHKPLPPGIGPDDNRIVQNVLDILESKDPRESLRNAVVFILLTGDNRMVRTISAYVRAQYPKHVTLIFQMNQSQYIGLCLAECQRREHGDSPFDVRNNIRYYNYITKQTEVFPEFLIKQIRKDVINRAKTAMFSPVVIYDFPNLERSIEPTTYRPGDSSVAMRSNGFLKVDTMRAFPKHRSWAAQPLDQISQMPDFSVTANTRYPLTGYDIRKGILKMYNSPSSVSSFQNTAKWSEALRQPVK